MIVKKVTQVGNPIIRHKSMQVTKIQSKQTLRLVKDLIDSMRYHNLVGMAAPQIGINARIFVSEVKKTKFRKPEETDKLKVYINPKIIFYSKKQTEAMKAAAVWQSQVCLVAYIVRKQ